MRQCVLTQVHVRAGPCVSILVRQYALLTGEI